MAQDKTSHVQIAGKVVAVTGGARGIGFEIASELVAQGAKVAIGDIDAAGASQAAAKLGANAEGFALDVTDRDSLENFLDQAEDRLGPLQVLINNAGVMALGKLLDESDDVMDQQIAINLRGVILGSKLGVARLLRNGGGHLINTGSGTSKTPLAGAATYSATKHAVYGLTEALAAEHRSDPISFSVVMPSVVNTRLAAGTRNHSLASTIEPEDVAEAVVRAIRHPRFDIFVPRTLGATIWFTSSLPYGVRKWLGKVLKADKVLLDFDSQERDRAYAMEVFEGRQEVETK